MSSTYLINRDVGDIMELFEGNNYRINIVGSDSSVILDSWSNQLKANVVTTYGTVLLDIDKETFSGNIVTVDGKPMVDIITNEITADFITGNLVTKHGDIAFDSALHLFKGPIEGNVVDQNNSIVLDNLNRSYYGNVFTQYNEIIVNSHNKTLHGELHGNVVNIHNETIVDAETSEVTATFISGNLITKTGEIAFDPELRLFKGTFLGQFVDGFGAVVVDSDTNEFFGNFIGSVYDTDKQLIVDCYEKKISNVDIYSRNIFSKDGLLLIDGETGEIRGDIYGGNIYDVNNQLMIDSAKHIVYSQVQGNVCDTNGEPVLNIKNRELVNTNIKGGSILSSYSDMLLDCDSGMIFCDVKSTSVSTEILTAGLADIKKISARTIEATELFVNVNGSMDEGKHAITLLSTTDDTDSVSTLGFVKVKNNFGSVKPGDKLTGLVFGGQVVDGIDGAYAGAVLFEAEVDPNGTITHSMRDGIIPGKFTIYVGNNDGDQIAGISTDMNGHTTTIIKDLNVVGNTGNVPLNTNTSAEWLEVIVNGNKKFIPLYS